MKKTLKNANPASSEEIRKLEFRLGRTMPLGYTDFLRHYNGATPDTNTFRIDDHNDSGVNRFIPIHEVLNERNRLMGRLPADSLPIAWAEGGNYVCLAPNGAVTFFDHETEQQTPLANTLEDFLAMLKPFDPSSVALKPGQVKSAWIDPDLLKRIEKKD